jgi:hypothetical protein
MTSVWLFLDLCIVVDTKGIPQTVRSRSVLSSGEVGAASHALKRDRQGFTIRDLEGLIRDRMLEKISHKAPLDCRTCNVQKGGPNGRLRTWNRTIVSGMIVMQQR